MRWAFAPAPKHGDVRERSGFLWRPWFVADEFRWLERARWEERYWVGTRSAHWLATRWLPYEAQP